MLKKRFIINVTIVSLMVIFMACSTTKESQKNNSSRIILAKAPGDSISTVIMPRLIGSREEFQRHVEYPESCSEAGAEGTVIIGFTVTKTGELIDFEVLKGIGWGCAEAAIRALQRYAEFTVGTRNGKPVAVHMAFPIVFRLN